MGLIRLLLAVTVLLWHCPEGVVSRMLHPALAVQCFYAISGFLIQMVICNSDRTLRGWKGRFYLSRWLRIYPLYALSLLLTLVLLPNDSLSEYFNNQEESAAFVSMFINAVIMGQDVARFFYFNTLTQHFAALPLTPESARIAALAVSGKMAVVPQSWTLALEFYFYLLAPFMLAWRTYRLFAIISVSIAVRVALGFMGHYQHGWFYGFFPSELGIFLMGAVAYRAYAFAFETGRATRLFSRIGGRLGERILLAVCTVIVLSVCVVYMRCDLNFAGNRWDSPLGAPRGYWLVLLMTVAALPFAFHFSKSMTWDKFIGELSYPVYISHFLLLELVTRKLQPANGGTAYIGLFVMVAAIMLGVVLVEFIERPIDRVRHRLSRSRHLSVLASGSAT